MSHEENRDSRPGFQAEEYCLNDFKTKYHPPRKIGWNVLNARHSSTASEIVESDEPIALASNSDENLRIEIYENKIGRLTDTISYLTGNLNDFILYLEYEEPCPSTLEDKNTETQYYGFNRKNLLKVKDYLDQFSDGEAKQYIRKSDLTNSIEELPPIERFQ